MDEANEAMHAGIRSLAMDFLQPLRSEPGFAPLEPSDDYLRLIDELAMRWHCREPDKKDSGGGGA